VSSVRDDSGMDEAFLRYYSLGGERDRLVAAGDRLELVRTLELLAQVLPPPPATVLDIGGGPGVYASRLARDGYRVHLIDVVPLHVEQARERATVDAPFKADLGDARDLSGFADESIDAVLLLGPLYHLTERTDRVRVLAEARRVVRPGGVVAAVAISRYASLIDGTAHGFLDDPRFVAVVERDLRDGQHRNPAHVEDWFTTAYFHLPGDLCSEVEDAGLSVERLAGVEGPGGWFDLWPDQRERVLRAARLAEDVPAMSAHMLCVARPT
jgi:ubiquinone/menaquinone biosynthesis C-methylase UbiE